MKKQILLIIFLTCFKLINAQCNPADLPIDILGNKEVCTGNSTTLTSNLLDATYQSIYQDTNSNPGAVNMVLGSDSKDLTSEISGTLYDTKSNGCAPFSANFLQGKIALISRGTCPFSIKVQNAVDAGAIAVIINNNTAGEGAMTNMSGTASSVPVFSISLEDAQKIKNQMVNNEMQMKLKPKMSYSYLWSTNETTSSITTGNITANTNYTLKITNTATNCSNTKTITVIPQTINTNIINYNSSLKSAENNATYQWYQCDPNSTTNTLISGATSQEYTPTSTSATYSVMVTKYGCSKMSTCTSFSSLSVKENDITQKIKIYPNPIKDIITIEAEKLNNPYLEINDISGKLIRKEKLNVGTNTINISQLSKGNYLVKIVSKEGTSTTKVIKE